MQLKKINANLQKALIENGLAEANEMQSETFAMLKSGVDAVIQSPNGSGKSTTIVLNVIQRLEKPIGESTRALILVENKEKVIEMVELFQRLGHYTNLRVIGVHEKGDIDYDKNQISLGMDVLIGTPSKVNDLFSSAGFNVNTVKMFAIDDADILFKGRMDAIVLRLSLSVEKTQYIFMCSKLTDKVETIADKIMIEPVFFESE